MTSNKNIDLSNESNLISVWGVNLQPVICEECDWRYLMPLQSPVQLCPNCRKAELVPLEDEHIGDLSFDYPPELLLPFTASTETLSQSIQRFAGGSGLLPAIYARKTLKPGCNGSTYPCGWLTVRCRLRGRQKPALITMLSVTETL